MKEANQKKESERDSRTIHLSGKVKGYQPLDKLDTSQPPTGEDSKNQDSKESK